MNLNQIKTQYRRLSNEIDAMADTGKVSEARITRLHSELDRIDQDLAMIRSLARTAPVLQDVVLSCSPPTAPGWQGSPE